MPKVNTLFAYFTVKSPANSENKSPKAAAGSPTTNNKGNDGGKKGQSSTPRSNSRQSKTKSSPTSSTKSTEKNIATTPKLKTSCSAGKCPFKLDDIVWAKLDGYPWWPSIISKDPDEEVFYRAEKSQAHVQFFGDQSRAWIKLKYIKKYTGPKLPDDVGSDEEEDGDWKQAVEEAEERRLRHKKGDDAEEEKSPEINMKESTPNGYNGTQQRKRKVAGSENGVTEKRRRIIIDSGSDDSGDEYKPGKGDDSDDSDVSSGVDEANVSGPESEPSDSDAEVVVKKPKKNSKTVNSKGQSSLRSSGISDATKAKLSMFSSAEASPGSKPAALEENKEWAHLKLDWLKDGNRKDMKGRPQTHPDYDPSTIFVPESFRKTLSPAMKQWWSIKTQHFDTVLFFKVGKFYELYHMDAVIGVNELGLIFMKGEFAHSGFPEISYGRYSDALIQRGYKVARVEQTETPQMMEERCKQLARPTKYDRVVAREVCRITSKGTRTLSFLDGSSPDHSSTYLLALTEKHDEGITGDESRYGVCFIDTTIGKFHIGQFVDDRHGSRMRTLIAHHPPAQILYVPGSISGKTQKMLNGCLASVLKEGVRPDSGYKDSSKTLQSLAAGRYFSSDEEDTNSKESKITSWPETLKKMLDDNDPLQQTARDEYSLAIQALGICVWYLKTCCIEEELLSMKNFEEYNPVDQQQREEELHKSYVSFQQHMVLDGVTLQNLEVLENSWGASEGTLLQTMDYCSTNFGKRLFRQWMCSPLCNPASINDRLNAVEDLHSCSDAVSEAVKLMKKLPDLERLLSKIHTQGSARRSKDHPDSRAIFYEDVTYSKRKIMDFLSALEGFRMGLDVIKCFEKVHQDFKSILLKKCVILASSGGNFPDLKEALNFFENAFDHEEAKQKGKIIPSKGVDSEYDSALQELKETEKELNEYLREQCRMFGCKVTYVGSGRSRYQLEIPEHAAKRVTDDYELQSQRKGFKRYWTQEVKDLAAKMMAAEDHRDAALKDIMRRIFASFDQRYKQWEQAVQCLSVLDALISITNFSHSFQGPVCRPEILLPEVGSQPFLEIQEGRHPCLMRVFGGGDFIPNDLRIGCSQDHGDSEEHNKTLVLVTGPNMGGKSTLMRQTGLMVIMAQMGSYVPATKFCLTPVDRVFTRLGANDRIMSGESTFYVELSETASILQHATCHSLVLMDELGRGTATYDGTAIACSVVQELAQNIQCRTLFSTHYHSLVDEFRANPNVYLGHMACMVENENKDDPTKESITFLYKFIEGACPKSYGFNVAQLAGIPNEVIKNGFQKAKEFESFVEDRKLFRLLLSVDNAAELCSLRKQIIAATA